MTKYFAVCVALNFGVDGNIRLRAQCAAANENQGEGHQHPGDQLQPVLAYAIPLLHGDQ